MFQTLSAKNFTAVPFLETSSLMAAHPQGLLFSTTKPNVVVGPNGAGKSALLTALALKTLAYFTGQSAFDSHYTRGSQCSRFWGERGGWRREFDFLPGLACETDRGPALYYRPGHLPGNERCVATAMMCGYMNEARRYRELTYQKSSGQQASALLDQVRAVLASGPADLKYGFVNWSAGRVPEEKPQRGYVGDYDIQDNELLKQYSAVPAEAKPVILMDEPEQSLDAKAELLLWKQIEAANCEQMQVIVATHSLYPLLHPERFHLIEAVPGYAEEVSQLL